MLARLARLARLAHLARAVCLARLARKAQAVCLAHLARLARLAAAAKGSTWTPRDRLLTLESEWPFGISHPAPAPGAGLSIGVL